MLQAGSYPEAYSDYKKTVQAFEAVLRALRTAKRGTGSLLAGAPVAE